jgi:hypothetical protein
MTQSEIIQHVHHPDSVLPPVWPCDTPNASDRQTCWSAEQLHRVTGCRTFKSYQNLLQDTCDGKFVGTDKFPKSLGTYTTVNKAPRGGPIARTQYRYLDKVHVDIGFGDTMSIGRYRYVLVFVNQATRYNWTFGLNTLTSTNIIEAFNLFKAEAGGFAKMFRTDCNEKLFGTAIKTHLTSQNSNVTHAPAGRQSSNGLIESHWKTMVHMSCAYLTNKQMP